MKKSQNKLNEEDLLKDIDAVLNYTKALSTLDIENADQIKWKMKLRILVKTLEKNIKSIFLKKIWILKIKLLYKK